MTMPIPQHYKPFNIDHARAGAPFCRFSDSEQYEVLKWDRKHTQTIVVVSKQDAAIRTFRADGTPPNEAAAQALVMTPLGMIDGKPVFVGDDLVTPTGMKWKATPLCKITRSLGDCSWPSPAPVYPETRMSGEDLHKAYVAHKGGVDSGMVAVANAALRHAIDAGQVARNEDYHVLNEMQQKAVRDLDKAKKTLAMAGYTDCGGEMWKPPLGAPAPTKEAYDQQSRDLGKAERLLESMGYRFLQGEWRQLAGIGDRAARDMAIAEAVRTKCVRLICDGGPEFGLQSIDLVDVVAGVKA